MANFLTNRFQIGRNWHRSITVRVGRLPRFSRPVRRSTSMGQEVSKQEVVKMGLLTPDGQPTSRPTTQLASRY
jgi:hypothetical protein